LIFPLFRWSSLVAVVLLQGEVVTAFLTSPRGQHQVHANAFPKYAVPEEQGTFEAENPGLFHATNMCIGEQCALEDVLGLVEELRQEKAKLVDEVVEINAKIQQLQSSEDEIVNETNRYENMDSSKKVLDVDKKTKKAVFNFMESFYLAMAGTGEKGKRSPELEKILHDLKVCCHIIANSSTSNTFLFNL